MERIEARRFGWLEGAHLPVSTAAGVSGVIAGLVYLLGQMLFSARTGVHGASASLHRIAAIILGDSEAPAASDLTFTVVVMALLIHLLLSFVYGRVIGLTLRRGIGRVRALLRGMTVGLAIFVVNFFIVAPSAFPWFVEIRNAGTAFDHLVFGGLCAVLTVMLSSRRVGVTSPMATW